MKPVIAAILNFFFMGAGTLALGQRKLVGAALTVGAIGLTYVELQLQNTQPTLWGIMFASVFVINTLLAVDGYREVKAIEGNA